MRIKKRIFGIALLGILMVGSLIASGHSTTLTWTASVDIPGAIPAGSGYNVYRASGTCPASGAPTGAIKLNSTVVAALTYIDSTITPGQWCYYATTLLNGVESVPSNSVQGATPVAPPTNVTIPNQQ